MRNLLLLLLLANILYLLWGWMQGEETPLGETIVDERQLGPKLELAKVESDEGDGDAINTPIEVAANDDADESIDTSESYGSDGEDAAPSDDPVAADVAEADDAESTADAEEQPRQALIAMVGRSCASIGPIRNREDADRAQIQYDRNGARAAIRQTTGEIFIGHWVQIRNIPSRTEAQEMLGKLHAGGFGEAYVIETEDEGIKISIGLFGEAEGAERVELEATSLGVPAIIAPRTSTGTLYFVDVALAPGQGASEIVGRYGEDKVSLRAEATCPGNA